MSAFLTIAAIIIGIIGIAKMVEGQIAWGLILVVLAFAVGPGGISIFT